MRSGKLITRLDRYIFRQLGVALFAVTGGLTALVWLVQSLRFVELVVNHGLSLVVFVELTGLLIPSFIAVILPITTFVVVQFIYQRLAGDREITVMRTAGMSPFALARPALAVAGIAVVCGYMLNLWLVPASLTSFREYQWEIRNRMAAFLLQEGVFTQVSDNLTVYVRSRDPDGMLRGILVDDGRDPTAHATIFAERGRMAESASGPRVVLFDGSREEIDHQTGRLNVLTFGQNDVDLTDNTNNGGQRLRDMSEMSVSELLDPHPYSKSDIPKWRAEGTKRLASPLTSVSYAFVALLSVLTGTFRRHGSFLRPLVAIGAMVALLAIGFAVENLSARNSALLPLMWLHAVVPGLVCAWLLLGPQLTDRVRYRLRPA
ncbi:MAG TPA: LPS export ABC transporter permease LptF [Acetobacteraceae bacterium]|jgi:lipopolysaccharide export system permease protein|nr:LPS export ABC transporter permease LptF [Acetobacteraceae bacterium]